MDSKFAACATPARAANIAAATAVGASFLMADLKFSSYAFHFVRRGLRSDCENVCGYFNRNATRTGARRYATARCRFDRWPTPGPIHHLLEARIGRIRNDDFRRNTRRGG